MTAGCLVLLSFVDYDIIRLDQVLLSADAASAGFDFSFAVLMQVFLYCLQLQPPWLPPFLYAKRCVLNVYVYQLLKNALSLVTKSWAYALLYQTRGGVPYRFSVHGTVELSHAHGDSQR